MSEPRLDSRTIVTPPGRGRVAAPLAEFLHHAWPKVEEILTRYRLPEQLAEEILRSTLQILVWKWESVRNREAWLLAVVERKCRVAADGGEEAVGG
jgi:hypothetical protein